MAARPKANIKRNNVSTVRLTKDERENMEIEANNMGFKSISEYIRFLHSQHSSTQSSVEPDLTDRKNIKYPTPELYFETDYGKSFLGDSLGLLQQTLKPDSVDLIMTSPPFGLVRKKSYGNEDADEYLKWFRPFAEGFKKVLKPQGSLVIDIGGAWKKGYATRSLYHYELLIMLCREYGFHLALEHFWWNPAKLPTPAEWVNIRRIRVKDSVNCVWWLSKTPWPKASNRRILAPYSSSMLDLLENGYDAKLRPSGHNISTKFQINNGGAIPPNLLAIANTESNGPYQSYCHANKYPIHPARFPSSLPEYFIRMLTDKGDLVVDPFGGSCVTGEVSERLKRNWICCELDKDFLDGAKGRFTEESRNKPIGESEAYSIFPPCSLPIDDSTPLPVDGGEKRVKKDNKDNKEVDLQTELVESELIGSEVSIDN